MLVVSRINARFVQMGLKNTTELCPEQPLPGDKTDGATLAGGAECFKESSMNTVKASLIATFVAAVVLCPRGATAMSIEMFDSLMDEDQREYLEYLVDVTRDVLTERYGTFQDRRETGDQGDREIRSGKGIDFVGS